MRGKSSLFLKTGVPKMYPDLAVCENKRLFFSFLMRLTFPGPEDGIAAPSKSKAEPHLGGDTGAAPSSCETPRLWGGGGCLRGPRALREPARPPTGRWVRGRDGEGRGLGQFSVFSKCEETNQQYFCLTTNLQKRRSISMLGKRLISCKVMHSELAAFLKQK